MAFDPDKYLASKKSAPFDPDAYLANKRIASGEVSAEPEEPGLASQAIDIGLRGLDYLGGVTRTAAGTLSGLGEEGDITNALKGKAPSVEDYLTRAGVPEGASASDVVPGLYENGLLQKGGMFDPNARDAAGFVGDVALDPLTYATFGAAPAIKGAKAAEMLLKPAATLSEYSGKKLYASGLKDIVQAGEKVGKDTVAETMLKHNIAGSAKSINRQIIDTADKVLPERDALLVAADSAGASVDMSRAMAKAEKKALAMLEDPATRDVAKPLLERIAEYKKLSVLDQGAQYVGATQPRVLSSKASTMKTNLYNNLPNSAFDMATKTKPGQKIQMDMALGIKDEIEHAANAASPGLGDAIKAKNQELGDLLTVRKASMKAANKEANKNALTVVDAALAAAAPAVAGAKKIRDLTKTSWFTTKTGKALANTGSASRGKLDIAARRLAIQKNYTPWTQMKEPQ